MKRDRIIVVGAGVGGLVAAALLARRGLDVTLYEKGSEPGGKMRRLVVGGHEIDGGPTVFTMRWVFDQIFAELGTSLESEISLMSLACLARHAWDDGARLDLFADMQRTADAIGKLSGPRNARGYVEFCERARGVYGTLEGSFIRASQPTPFSLSKHVGISGLPDLWRISPFTTLWKALGDYFIDPKLRQLFGRYATYCGCSPFDAPATLMLVAHVEQSGVWSVTGGMHRLAQTLARLAVSAGVKLRYDVDIARIETAGGGVRAIVTREGERSEAEAIVFNGDAAALPGGLLGADVQRAISPINRKSRSLSAVTWALAAEARGFPLMRHNVFFSSHYEAEFDDIFKRDRLPRSPSIYVCAQDRLDDGEAVMEGPERLLCLVNAPASGDARAFNKAEIEPCEEATFQRLSRCGLTLARAQPAVLTTPADFHRLFPATGGALYGQAGHGWAASFSRPAARTKIQGLYLAGGSVHPGPGVPMAAISGWLAAASLAQDLGLLKRSQMVAMPGGTSMP